MKFFLSFSLFVLGAANLQAQAPQPSSASTPSVVLSEGGDSPVILFDKREITQGELAAMDQQKIGDIKILNGEEAKERFGKYGNYGVIVITSTSQTPVKTVTAMSSAPAERVPDGQGEEVKMSFGTDLKALVVIDGKPSTMEVLEAMSTEQIKEMNVLKESVAVEKYGGAAKDGAIEVTTKQ